MRFVIRARKGWKGKLGQAYFKNFDIKLNVIDTGRKREEQRLLFYDILKVIVKYYDIEYVDRPTAHTGKAGHSGKHKRIIIDEVDTLIEKLMGDPTLKELKKRIMASSNKLRKQKEVAKKKHYYIKDNKCCDCDKLISNQAQRCHRCAGIHIGKTRRKGMYG